MDNVILVVHLILALCLIGIVPLQRSEGGGLGMGGGGGGAGGGLVSSRAAATALGKLTWGFAIAFIITSLTLTMFAARNAADNSVIDQIGGTAPPAVVETPAIELPTLDTETPPTGDAAPRAD